MTDIPYLTEFLTVAIVHLLAVVSPGPDFALVSKNSLTASRKIAMYSALGIALGILVHVSFALLGISWLVAKSAVAFSVVKYLGAAYLIYLGLKALRVKSYAAVADTTGPTVAHDVGAALWSGFLTNVLNPKAAIFFLGLFTQVINVATPNLVKVVYGTEMFVATFAWFALVAFMLSHGSIKGLFRSIMHHVDHAFGVVLILLGCKVALSRQ